MQKYYKMSARVCSAQNLFKSYKHILLTHSLQLNGEGCIPKCPDSLDLLLFLRAEQGIQLIHS